MWLVIECPETQHHGAMFVKVLIRNTRPFLLEFGQVYQSSEESQVTQKPKYKQEYKEPSFSFKTNENRKF